MPEKAITVVVLYLVAPIAGALGGAAAGAHVFLSRKGFKAAFILAYALIGAATAAGIAAYFLYTAPAEPDWPLVHKIVTGSVVGGACSSLMLSIMHLAGTLVLKYKGIEVQVTAREKDEDRRVRDG